LLAALVAAVAVSAIARNHPYGEPTTPDNNRRVESFGERFCAQTDRKDGWAAVKLFSMQPGMEALKERMLAACRMHIYACQTQCRALSEFVRTGHKEDGQRYTATSERTKETEKGYHDAIDDVLNAMRQQEHRRSAD